MPGLLLVLLLFGSSWCQDPKKNVLLIIIDDLRPEIGAYGGDGAPPSLFPDIQTPFMDSLAANSLLVKRSYVQQALCSPSRSSFLTGRRPDTTHVYNLNDYFRDVGGNFSTIPQHFKDSGYVSLGFGKVFHRGRGSGNNDPISWTEANYIPLDSINEWHTQDLSWRAVNRSSTEKIPLPDQSISHEVIKALREFTAGGECDGQQFFMGLGFYKPHLPFTFPEEFLELYPEDDIIMPDNPHAPSNMPTIAWSDWIELRMYDDIAALNMTGAPNETLSDEMTRSLRRAYQASVSYVDSLIGSVLYELDVLGLSENTIVAMLGDHGFLLGEHGGWCKNSNFDLATRIPMMVKVPGLTDGGMVSNHLTEAVDMFPTLVEAAGLPDIPLCPEDSSDVYVCSEGMSLIQLMHGLNKEKRVWKSRIFTQNPRSDASIMGYSMTTERFRYSEWPSFLGFPVYAPDWEDLHGVELYDHHADPYENRNIAGDAEYAEIEAELKIMLRAGWRAALPQIN